MTTLDARMLADAIEKLLADLDNHLTVDSFFDQTVHACAHGIGLTKLGRLISEERAQMKPHGNRQAVCALDSTLGSALRDLPPHPAAPADHRAVSQRSKEGGNDPPPVQFH